MNAALLEKIVQAVLYEGYILYPYRASAKKNRQRFTFGRVYPRDYSVAQEGAEPCEMQTECLVRALADEPVLKITVRFLHPMARAVGVLTAPVFEMPAKGEPSFELVDELSLGGKLYQTWQEAVERAVELSALPLREADSVSTEFRFASSRTLEPIRHEEQIVAVFLRRQAALVGAIQTSITRIDAEVCKVKVRISNETPVPAMDLENQDAIVRQTFASTHTVLEASGAEFISLLEPPNEYADAAAACANIHTWPVLAGDPKKAERDTMLSSPIILYDYPQIAPQSPGDLFDGAEIDEILTLRIMTMTDAEKMEMRQVDEQARKILERTEMLPPDHLLKMHGEMREVSAAPEEFFNPGNRLQTATVRGVQLKVGDRVRIRPRKRADIMDIALEGKIAMIEAIEEDVENGVHFALVLDDDPGRDLGLLRQSGHRFFYSADEVEPIETIARPE
jgi:hypothetical protein